MRPGGHRRDHPRLEGCGDNLLGGGPRGGGVRPEAPGRGHWREVRRGGGREPAEGAPAGARPGSALPGREGTGESR